MTTNHSLSPQLTPAQQAILLRLLPPTKSAPSPKVVMTTCNKLFRPPLSSEAWTAASNELRAGGLLEAKGMKLTEEGRQRALALLELDDVPPRTTWSTLQARFLLPVALGKATAPEAERKRLNSQDKLAALLLTHSQQLPANASASLKNALEALVCQQLGFSDLSSLEELKEVVLSQRLKTPGRLTGKQLLKYVPRVLLNLGKDGLPALRDAALAGWAEAIAPDHQAPAVEPSEPDLPSFAALVISAAHVCPSGWFGDNKVFINHVWRQLREQPTFKVLELAEFKRRLIEASKQRLLVLSRADLVQLMPAHDVDESTTADQHATYHFILVDRKVP
ncbi:hypothetical protein BH10PLA2_BH10PLA2_29680 [soil metagenome]